MALKPHPEQQMILDSRCRYIVAATGRRWGKMELFKFATDQQWNQRYGGQILYVAPNNTMTSMAARAFAPLLEDGIFFYTATPGIDLEAEHLVDLLLVDEPGLMKASLWNRLKKLVRPKIGRMIAIGTPVIWRHKPGEEIDLLRYLWSLAGKRPDQWQRWHFPIISLPHLDPGELKQIKESYPSTQWRSQFGAEFLDEEGRSG